MEFYWLGCCIILISFILVVSNRELKFLDLFVFSIPFTSTAVMSIAGTPISLPLAFFFISCAAYLIKSFVRFKIVYPSKAKQTLRYIYFIGFITLMSGLMPFIINGDYIILDRYKSIVYYAEEVALVPDIQYVTQLFYFIFGLIISFLIVVEYRDDLKVRRMLKFLLSGVVFMMIWGWFEYFCFFLNIDYPYWIFNHIGMTRTGTIYLHEFPRMTSVTMEPSYLAQTLTPAIPFFYWLSEEKDSVDNSKQTYKILCVLSIVSLLIAQTSTGIIGAGDLESALMRFEGLQPLVEPA